jgi:hypothetical protein
MTGAGAIMIGGAVYVYLAREGSEVFALALLGLGALAFGLKDPKMPGGGAAAAMLLCCVFLFTSCVTYNKCLTRFGTMTTDSVQVTTQVTVYDTVKVPVKGEQITAQYNIDSILHMVDTLRHVSESGRLQVKLWRDKYSRALHMSASVKPDTVTVIRTKIVPVKVNCPPVINIDPDKSATWHRRLWKGFQLFAAWALLAGLLVFIIIKVLRR